MKKTITSTYSIVAIDPIEGAIGSAAASCVLAAGAIVPHIKQNVGAVNSQHYSSPKIAHE